MAYSLSNIYTY